MNNIHLIKNFNDRERFAWKQLFDAYYPEIVLFIHSIIKDMPASEELASSCFEKIWVDKKLAFDSCDKLKNFLLITAHNKAIDLLRKKKLDKSEPVDIYEIEAMNIDGGELPNLGKTYVFIAITKVINCFSPRLREIMQLRYYEEMGPVEIAQLLGVSEQTVHNQLQVGLKRLRKKIKRHPLDPLLAILCIDPFSLLFR